MIGRTLALALLLAACTATPPPVDPTAIPTPGSTAAPATATASVRPTNPVDPPPDGAPTTTSAVASNSPASTQAPKATPNRTTLTPEEVIPADNGGVAINMVGFGDYVWATVVDGLLRIDSQTGEATTVAHSEPASDARYLAASSDWIWLSDFYNRTVHRVDPATGEITGTTEVPGDPRTILIGDDGVVWAPTNGGSTYRIDADTMDIVGEPIPHQASAYGMGSLWVGQDETGPVLRVDPETAEVLAEIAIPADGSGCRVAGSFPDGVFGWCGLVSNRHVVTRLDPDADTAVGSVDLGGATSSSSGVLATDDEAWFPLIAPGPGQSGRLVRVSLEANDVDRVFDGGPNFDVNELVIAGDALWASMEGPQEIWRIPLEQIGASR